ncbi:MAG TPA: ABC transporter permease [Thermoanaerobaculia bacterium]
MLLRGLTHFWRANLAVALGAAVASTVLTGALLAGDSVRGSLTDLMLDRLGGIDSVLISQGFFREELGAELNAAPLIVARASAVHGSSSTRASGIAVYGVDERFSRLHGRGEGLPKLESSGGIFPPAVINESLAQEIGAKAGDDLLLSFELPGEIPRETLLGDKDADDVLVTRRFTVARVVPDRGIGGFGLAPHQARARNAFVSLAALQEVLDRKGKANAMLASGPAPDPRKAVRLEDLGLRIIRGPDHVSLESEGFFVNDAAVEVAEKLGQPRRVFTYLATSLKTGDRLLPYSMVTGLSSFPVADGQILLNQWAADDLGARPGDAIELRYLVMAPGGGLVEKSAVLKMAGVVPMTGLGADRTLTPTFPGIEEAEDIAAWDPPFPVDLSTIRPKDEQYWDDYGASPKAFVSLETARRLWSTRFGDLTALRFEGQAEAVAADPPRPGINARATQKQPGKPDWSPLQGALLTSPGIYARAGGTTAELDRIESSLRAELPAKADLPPFGLVFHPVKNQGLSAAQGSTDFAGLFLAFSFFLIISAVLLAGLLFSLAVERRAGELGMLLALGYPVRAVRRRLLAEGAVLAGAGALLGLAGALGYAWLLMAGLRTWWLPAVGTPDLYLHVEPSSLIVGWIASVLAVLVAIFFTVRRLARIPAPALLAGRTTAPGPAKPGRLARPLAIGGAALALALALTMALSGETSSPALAFGAGAALLVSGLAAISLWLRRPRPSSRLTLLGMAARNGAASPGRSLLSVALVAAACFVLVTVAANRRSGDAAEIPEGAGGFPLYAESAVPLAADPNDPEGRLTLGLSEDESLAGVSILPLRLVPGDDASCLNLFRPERPRLLGVPPQAFAGRFHFLRAVEQTDNPWSLLDRDFGPGVIPVIADEASATWILKLRLGEDLEMTDEAGGRIRLRLVALLDHSLFQSELLSSEKNLLRHFPRRAGRSFFLIQAPHTAQVSQALEEGLARYGFDVSSTAGRIAAYGAVEATYLQTFGALGGFGLLLGTLGLGIALLRGVIERRGELAALRAFGYRRRRLVWMITAENGFLLLLGVALGTAAGLLAVAPRLAAGGDTIPWTPLLSTLLAVLALGFASSLAAVWSALQAPLLPVLKEER